MKILPKVVQALVTSTPDATRVRDNLTAAVQPTLSFLNTYFKSATDGTLQVLKNIQTLGQVINGQVSISGGATFTWRGTNFTLFPTNGNGCVIIPGTACDPVFYMTNPSNTDALILGTQAGLLSAVNLSSRAGITQTIDCGAYWNSNATANTMYQTVKAVVNNNGGATGQTNFVWKFPRAGSIVGYSLNNAGPLTGGNYISYYKNGSQIVNFGVGSGANNATFWGTHAKGTYAFAAGDTLTTAVGNTAAGNYQASLLITVELSA